MSAYSDKVIADGAVAYWRLDEASGNALSQVGNFPGTVSGGVTRSQTGPLSDGNSAMLFDGINGEIALPSITIPIVHSLEVWMKTPVSAAYKTILSNRSAPGTIWYGVGDGSFVVFIGAASVASTVRIDDGNWHHLVATNDGTTGVLYLDGVLHKSGALANAAPQTAVLEIADDASTAANFQGTIDEVAIYPTALTAAQVATHYALRQTYDPYAAQVIGDGAVAYWRLNETSGTVAKSEVGSFDGTISGGVTLGQPGAISGYTAMAFDGTTGKIVTPSLIKPITVTLEAWIKTTSMAQQPVTILDGISAGSFIGTMNGVARVVENNVFMGTRPLADGQWHYLVVTFTPTTCTIYCDGTLEISGANNRAAANATIQEIGFITVYNLYWQGSIDEVAIYPTALTPQQIAAHYQSRTAWPDTPYIAPLPPVVYPGYNAIANQWAPVTPHDSTDAPFGKLWVGGAGNLTLVGADGRVVTFAGVKAGTMLPLAGRRINATNTTASAILALRTQ